MDLSSFHPAFASPINHAKPNDSHSISISSRPASSHSQDSKSSLPIASASPPTYTPRDTSRGEEIELATLGSGRAVEEVEQGSTLALPVVGGGGGGVASELDAQGRRPIVLGGKEEHLALGSLFFVMCEFTPLPLQLQSKVCGSRGEEVEKRERDSSPRFIGASSKKGNLAEWFSLFTFFGRFVGSRAVLGGWNDATIGPLLLPMREFYNVRLFFSLSFDRRELDAFRPLPHQSPSADLQFLCFGSHADLPHHRIPHLRLQLHRFPPRSNPQRMVDGST